MKLIVENLEEWNALPELYIKKITSNQESGSMYQVSRVGFVRIRVKEGIMPHPTITILESQEEKFCRLPLELNAWAFDVVAIAHAMENPFPCEVEFCNIQGKYTADFT